MATTGRPVVDFERPPVAETILGVQFSPLRGLDVASIALYWNAVRVMYPTHEIKPPLTPVTEDFEAPAAASSPSIGLELTSEPDVRFWLIDRTLTQLLQIQRDRFIRNWRKREPPNDSYPRYDQLRPRFEQDWTDFLAYLEREGIGTPEVNQCEVTYINHIEPGEVWNSLGEAHKVLRVLRPLEEATFLPEPEVAIANLRYVMPVRRGRLHVAAQPAVRRQDGRLILQVTLTTRGRPESSRIADILAWFNLGHEWIVRGFVDLTTPMMHAVWGRL